MGTYRERRSGGSGEIRIRAPLVRRHVTSKGREREGSRREQVSPQGEGTQGHPSTAVQVRNGPEHSATVAEAVFSASSATWKQSARHLKTLGMTRKRTGGTWQTRMGVDFFTRGRSASRPDSVMFAAIRTTYSVMQVVSLPLLKHRVISPPD